MNKFRMICGVICLTVVMSFATACSSGESKPNTPEDSNAAVSSEADATTIEAGKDGDNNVALAEAEHRDVSEVQYKKFRVIVDVDGELKEKSFETAVSDNGGIIPSSLLAHSFIINAYYLKNSTPYDIIIADNTTDALNKLNNNFTLDETGKTAVFRSDVTGDGETPNELTVAVDTLETGELYIKAADNVYFVEYDESTKN